jgi:hypothetical protein
MIMANRFLMAIVLLVTCLFGTAWAGTASTGFLYDLNVLSEQYSGSTYFAQNSQKNPPDNASADDASKTRKDTNKPKTSTQEKTVPEKTKPVKPFVPSETIPVDQGVDLPYDI